MVSSAREKFDAFPHKTNHMRMSLDYLRNHFRSFDIPTLASQSGVTASAIYRALLKQPIEQEEAMKVLGAISEMHNIDPPLTLNDIDIPVFEDLLVLHVAHASGSQDSADDYVLVYAQDEEHARTLLKRWIEPLSASHPTIKITPMKDGIPVFGGSRIPGHNGKAK